MGYVHIYGNFINAEGDRNNRLELVLGSFAHLDPSSGRRIYIINGNNTIRMTVYKAFTEWELGLEEKVFATEDAAWQAIKDVYDNHPDIKEDPYEDLVEDGMFSVDKWELVGMDEFVPVVTTKDGDAHNYIVPVSDIDEFNTSLSHAEETDEVDDFNDRFQKYSVGGSYSLYQLHMSKEELKRLTGE
jgi:hypothetical protein